MQHSETVELLSFPLTFKSFALTFTNAAFYPRVMFHMIVTQNAIICPYDCQWRKHILCEVGTEILCLI